MSACFDWGMGTRESYLSLFLGKVTKKPKSSSPEATGSSMSVPSALRLESRHGLLMLGEWMSELQPHP